MESSPTLVRVRRIIAGLMAGLVLVMALLAGRHLFLGESVIEIHGYLGNFLFVLAIANIGLVVSNRASTGLDFGLAVAIGALVFAQIGLGYVGRETLDAAAWHVPNGVLLMSLSTYQFAAIHFREIPAPA